MSMAHPIYGNKKLTVDELFGQVHFVGDEKCHLCFHGLTPKAMYSRYNKIGQSLNNSHP